MRLMILRWRIHLSFFSDAPKIFSESRLAAHEPSYVA
jgi:hypothetical protein